MKDIKNENNFVTPSKNVDKYKEFYSENYYFKIGINDKEIYFIIFNIKLLNSIKYETRLKQNEIYTLSKIFKMYENLEEIYEALIKLIENNNYKIENKNNDIILSFIICDLFQNNKTIQIILYKNDKDNEYMKII